MNEPNDTKQSKKKSRDTWNWTVTKVKVIFDPVEHNKNLSQRSLTLSTQHTLTTVWIKQSILQDCKKRITK